jgi:acetoacetate decarboxylase
MGFVKTPEELASYFELGTRRFAGAQMLGVFFLTRPEIVARLLPAPLAPDETPRAMMFIAEYPSTNLGPGYREAALFLGCRYRSEPGNYCLSMPIDGQESRLYNGRDIFGYPKKMARIHLAQEGPELVGWVERHGTRFVEIRARLTGNLPEMPKPGPNFLFKASPRIDLRPGFDGTVLLCRQQTDVDMKQLRIGSAEVILRECQHDPWAEVEVTELIFAYHLVSDNTMQPGSVLQEVEPDGFLPHYFKMTDFFAG